MTKTPTPGEQFHFLKSMAFPTDLTSSGGGTVSRRGQVATVTEKLLEAGRDRNGDCWLDLLHYPEKQEARWGSVVIVPGLPDKDFDCFEKGSVEEDMAREAARTIAAAIPDPAECQRALAAVTRQFGIKSSQVSVQIDGGRFA